MLKLPLQMLRLAKVVESGRLKHALGEVCFTVNVATTGLFERSPL
jgi:hypothetical protein